MLESLELTAAVLVGWSMGSFVIWDYVRQFGTDRLAGVVIVDQSASDYGWPDWPYGFLDFDELCHVMAAVQTDRAALFDEFIPLLFKDDPGEHGDWIREAAGGIPPTIASSIIFDQTVQDFRSLLASVDVPALVCFGRDEKLVPVAAGEHLAASMPHARLVVFEESGHSPFVEESDRFNETVDEFVRSLG